MNIVDSRDVPGYRWFSREWAESEVIYNHDVIAAFLKSSGFGDVTHTGIMHWDFNLYATQAGTSRVTENIDQIVKAGYDYISFFPGQFGHITGRYNVLMDERMPNCLFVGESGLQNPRSANDVVFEWFMSRISPSAAINQAMVNPSWPITLCCSGVFPEAWFGEAKAFMDKLLSDRIEDKYDIQRRHRFPGQVMERFVAVDSLFRKVYPFRLDHRFTGGLMLKANDPEGENY